MKEHGCHNDGEDDAQLVNGGDLRGEDELQGTEIADPGESRCDSREDQKDPCSS